MLTYKRYEELFDQQNRGKKIIIFGISQRALNIYFELRHFGFNVIGFTDSKQLRKTQSLCCGKEIYTLDEIFSHKKEWIVIVATRKIEYQIEIIKLLNQNGIENAIVYCQTFGVVDNALPEDERMVFNEVVTSRKDEISKVYNSLKDDVSKQIYNNLIEFYKSGNTKCLFSNYYVSIEEGNQYFPEFLDSLIKYDVFVDCGVEQGSNFRDFIQKNKNYKKIYGFEPSEDIFEIAKSSIEINNYQNIELFNYGVADDNKKVIFKYHPDDEFNGAFGHLNNTSSNLNDVNLVEKEVTLVSIDSILKEREEKISYIKMDIEGSEKSALQGARNTILNDKPALAISTYHKMNDFWEIPLFILENFPGYDIYYRHYRYTKGEQVCYAVYNGI